MKKLLFSFAALAALVACNQNGGMNPPTERQVSIVANTAETKTTLSGNAVSWDAADVIKVHFAAAEDQDVEAVQQTFTTAEGGAEATFTGKLHNDVSPTGGYAETGYAVYPATAMDENGAVLYTLPAAVTVDNTGSFQGVENLSSAEIDLSELVNDGTTTANFLNAFSIIRFNLDANVASLKLTASNPIVGTATMAFGEGGRLVKSGELTEPSAFVTVAPASEQTFNNSIAYNVLVFPGSYTSFTAEMTDVDGCTYTKTVEGSYTFAAAKFYSFNFQTQFERTYTFSVEGIEVTEGAQIQPVVGSTPLDVVTAAQDLSFTGNTTHDAWTANTAGYAIYPADRYNAGNLTFTIPADGSAVTDALYSAKFSLKTSELTFTPATDALAKLQFTVPAGVTAVSITSDKGFVGTAPMTVDANGKLVAGTADGKTITLESVEPQPYTLDIFPVSGANLTVTLTTVGGATSQTFQAQSVDAGGTMDLTINSDIDLNMGGDFTHENFTEGGETIQL